MAWPHHPRWTGTAGRHGSMDRMAGGANRHGGGRQIGNREAGSRSEPQRRYGSVASGGGGLETHSVRLGLFGTCVGSPLARTSSAAREQFPLGMFHQFEVMGYASVYEVGSCAAMQL